MPPVGATADGPLEETRAFGEPLHWLNRVPDNRLPRRERVLGSSSLSAPSPPPGAAGQGLHPYVTVASEYRDNVFLTTDDEVDDVILTLTPGLEYLRLGPNWTFLANGAVEAARFLDESDESRVFNGVDTAVGGSIAVSPVLAFDLFNSYAETRETGDTLVPNQLPPLTRIRTNAFVATARGRPSERLSASGSYRNTLQFTEEDASSDIVEHTGEAHVDYRLDPRARLGGAYEAGLIDYSGGDVEWTQSARAEAEVEIDERLVLSGHGGVIATGADGGRVFPDAGASASLSWSDLLLTVSADRDLVAAVGVEAPVLSTGFSVEAIARLDHGLLLDVRVENRWLTVIDAQDTDVTSLEAQARLSYAIADDLWVWGRYRFQRDDPGDDLLTANRVIVGLTRSF